MIKLVPVTVGTPESLQITGGSSVGPTRTKTSDTKEFKFSGTPSGPPDIRKRKRGVVSGRDQKFQTPKITYC